MTAPPFEILIKKFKYFKIILKVKEIRSHLWSAKSPSLMFNALTAFQGDQWMQSPSPQAPRLWYTWLHAILPFKDKFSEVGLLNEIK